MSDKAANGSAPAHEFGEAADMVAVRAPASSENMTEPPQQEADAEVFTDVFPLQRLEGIGRDNAIANITRLLQGVAKVDPAPSEPNSFIIQGLGNKNKDLAAELMAKFLKSFDEINLTVKRGKRGEAVRETIKSIRLGLGLNAPIAANSQVAIKGIPEEKLTPRQRAYKEAAREKSFVIAHGPAGTGKTAIAIEAALELYNQGKIKKILLVKPIAISKDENNVIGAFKGGPEEKFEPYFDNILDLIEKRIGADKLATLRSQGIIEIKPFSMMRGQNFDGAFVILDEGQNCTPSQMRTALTRLADNDDGSIKPRIIITGHLEQKDTAPTVQNGLLYALVHFTPSRISNSYQVEFQGEDIKRSKIAAEVDEAAKGPDQMHPLFERYRREFGIAATATVVANDSAAARPNGHAAGNGAGARGPHEKIQ